MRLLLLLNEDVQEGLWQAVQVDSFIESIQLFSMNLAFSLTVLFNALNNVYSNSQQYHQSIVHFRMTPALQSQSLCLLLAHEAQAGVDSGPLFGGHQLVPSETRRAPGFGVTSSLLRPPSFQQLWCSSRLAPSGTVQAAFGPSSSFTCSPSTAQDTQYLPSITCPKNTWHVAGTFKTEITKPTKENQVLRHASRPKGPCLCP